MPLASYNASVAWNQPGTASGRYGMRDRALAATLGSNGRAFFRRDYSWPVIERKYLDMFDRLRAEPAEVVARRLRDAQAQLARCGEYDYLVMNDVLETADAQLQGILVAEEGGDGQGGVALGADRRRRRNLA